MVMAEIHIALQKLIAEVTGDPRFLIGLPTDYDKRVVAQKIVYLLQSKFGVTTRWSFNWYIAGPYSPSLARDLYAIAENADEIIRRASRARLTDGVAPKVRQLKALLDVDHARIDLTRAQWLELLASIDFIAKWKERDLSDPGLVDLVVEAKPQFLEDQIREGIRVLRERTIGA
jgi:uncharacterized protein YwgA